ncbi:Protein CBR-CHAT-1 [Aphelenchoides besseyi]|nr:Protein CBR-CHAT-1 [Aphelenchoides besseyi]KAI6209955.1 Protein CBR-CHAT-1 [Aphelenchoides besseyi]
MPPRRNAAESDEPLPRVVQNNNTQTEDSSRTLKNRPNPSKLRQQKLSAWQPILTACTAIPAIFVTGLIFIPIGIVLLVASESVKEWEIDYGLTCQKNLGQKCYLPMYFSEPFTGNVYFYYQLENYFQNHRRYNVGSDCAPYDYVTFANGTRLPIAPCGAIANSMFNDSFVIYKDYGSDTQIVVPLTYEGVLWEVDRDTKFKNPGKSGEDLCDAFRNTVKPPNWKKEPCNLDKNDAANNGFQNVDFIVWMRTAALPTFRKLYRLLNRNADERFVDGLPAGNYTLEIDNFYPVDMFNGKKYFVISTTSWVGGRNRFLGIAFIVTGSICMVLAFAFTFIHFKFGHSLSEMADIRVN